MQRESRTLYMADNTEPTIVIEGVEEIIKRDLQKHRMLLERAQEELLRYREGRSHLVKRKKHYRNLVGNGQYDDEALQRSMEMIAIDIRQISDRCKVAEDSIQHHTFIVDTLTQQLAKQEKDLDALERYREEYRGANRH